MLISLFKRTTCMLLFPIIFLTACNTATISDTKTASSENGKVKVVATLFPQYDFARQIAGTYADVSLLLPPGMDSHAYEPTPSDILAISGADVFLYTGPQMEVWAQNLLNGIKSDTLLPVDLSEGMSLVAMEDIESDGTESDHNHDLDIHTFEPHIWTSPIMAQQMARSIGEALTKADPENAAIYNERTTNLIADLQALDQKIRAVIDSGQRRDFIFGSRFASYYFAREYGLNYDSAFDSCAGETEPGAQAMARLISHIQEAGVPVIYYQELTDNKVAMVIAEATGTKPLLFHSCHNVTKEELEQGVTYFSLMEQNLEHLKEGLAS